MLGALAGGEALEIIVALKDLASGGFSKVETNLKHMEGAANNTNLGGVSKSMKTVETDATKLAGKEVKGGGGIGGLAAGMMSLGGGPVTIAVGALAALAGAGMALTATYDKVAVQEKALEIAAKDHGIAVADLTKHVQASIDANAQFGFGAEDTRGAIIKLTEAGMSLGDQQSSMNDIMDLARTKNMSLTDTAKMYELALMGNAKAVKDLGIKLPPVTDAQKAHDKAQQGVTKSSTALTAAQNALKLMEDSLAGKHKLTATEADRLKMAHDKVKTASDALKTAQDALGKTQDAGALKADRLKQVNDAITTAVGNQRTAVSPLTVAQAELGNMWDKLATKVGPGLLNLFTRLVQGLVKVVGAIIDVVTWLGKMFAAITKNNSVGIIKPAANGYGPFGVPTSSAVPRYASGGVVDRPTLAMIGEGGEREYVIPESKMGAMGGQTTTVHHTHIYLDGNVIADVVERTLGARLALHSTSIGSI